MTKRLSKSQQLSEGLSRQLRGFGQNRGACYGRIGLCVKCLPTLNCLKVIERVLDEQRMRAVNAQVGAAVFAVEKW